MPGGEEIGFRKGETIHTENSYKFNAASLEGLLGPAGFRMGQTYMDAEELFAVTLAAAV